MNNQPQQPPLLPPNNLRNLLVKGQSFASQNPAARNPFPGDPVILEGLSQNPHDSNAISVKDMQGRHHGYVAREDAAALRQAGFVDAVLSQMIAIVIRTGTLARNWNTNIRIIGRLPPQIAAAHFNLVPAPAAPVVPPAPVYGPVHDRNAQLQHALRALDHTKSLLRASEAFASLLYRVLRDVPRIANECFMAEIAAQKRQRTE